MSNFIIISGYGIILPKEDVSRYFEPLDVKRGQTIMLDDDLVSAHTFGNIDGHVTHCIIIKDKSPETIEINIAEFYKRLKEKDLPHKIEFISGIYNY